MANNILESYKHLREQRDSREQKRLDAIKEAEDSRNKFLKNYHSIIESREIKQRHHAQLLEDARNFNLSTALKAIYITALEAYSLTDDGILLAEAMVDNYIKENGGATKIFNTCKADTYTLARLRQIVEDAAKEDVEEIEKAENDNGEESTESGEKEVEEKDDTSSKEQKDEDTSETKDDTENKETKSEESAEDSEEEEIQTDDESEEKTDDKGESDPLTDTSFDDEDTEVPDDPTTTADDNETDIAEDIVDDVEDTPEEDITVDGDTENNGKVFDELEKEEDIRKAIELIRQRVADAEETFIKRNAEDKKAIDELISRISDNVKTVEDLDDEASAESKIAQESARICRQKINNITENRPLSIMEKMVRNISRNITKDQAIREQYLKEDNTIDTQLVVEAGKVMYGFLETLNTLQLEKVDVNYIQSVLDNMS